jgi:hypothetical protein
MEMHELRLRLTKCGQDDTISPECLQFIHSVQWTRDRSKFSQGGNTLDWTHGSLKHAELRYAFIQMHDESHSSD